MTLKKITYITVLIASVMAIGWFAKQNLKGGTEECDIAKEMADTNLSQAYKFPDTDNELIERAGHYASYYEAFCS